MGTPDIRTAAGAAAAAAPPEVAIDASRRWVQAVHVRDDGFVEFEFCVGDEQLCVELILPPAAFREFCLHNRVPRVDDATGLAPPALSTEETP